jgi:hypothetical protein
MICRAETKAFQNFTLIEGRSLFTIKLIIRTYKKQNNKTKSTYSMPVNPWKTFAPFIVIDARAKTEKAVLQVFAFEMCVFIYCYQIMQI